MGMLVKLTYGPLVTAISLIKAEAFPTEVRASAFSLISVVAKFACMLAPSLIEEMRGSGWSTRSLDTYLLFLCGSVLACGIIMIRVPGADGNELADYVDDKKKNPLTRGMTG